MFCSKIDRLPVDAAALRNTMCLYTTDSIRTEEAQYIQKAAQNCLKNKVMTPQSSSVARPVVHFEEAGCHTVLNCKERGDKVWGRGIFKTVYTAIDTTTAQAKAVGITLLSNLSSFDLALLEKESHLMRLCKGASCIVQLHGELILEHIHCLLMDLCEEGSLEKAVQENRIGIWEDKIIYEMALGMSQLHGIQVIHRDVKPENVLLGRDLQGQLFAKISDLGLSCEFKDLESRKNLPGSLMWLSPEQGDFLIGKADVSAMDASNFPSDIWGLGLVIYYTCTKGKFLSHQQAIDSVSTTFFHATLAETFKILTDLTDEKIQSEKETENYAPFKDSIFATTVMENMLKRDFKARLTAAELFEKVHQIYRLSKAGF